MGTQGTPGIVVVLMGAVFLGGVVLYGFALGDLARYKGRNVAVWVVVGYAAGLFLFSLVPLLVLALSGNLRLQRREREEYEARIRAERAHLQICIDDLRLEMRWRKDAAERGGADKASPAE